MPFFKTPRSLFGRVQTLLEAKGWVSAWLVFTCPWREITRRLPRCQEGTLPKTTMKKKNIPPTTDFKGELELFSTDEYLVGELYQKTGKVVILSTTLY